MRKFTLTAALFACAMMTQAQNAPIDFEPGGNGASWTWTVFENDINPPLNIIANPDQSGINTSATVAEFTALQTGNPWAGCESMHGADIGTFTIDSITKIIKISVWKTVISDVGIKLVDSSGFSLGEIKVPNTVTNQWEELTFDFTTSIGIEYDQIVIFPDFNARTGDNVIYFDNIVFGNQNPPPPPPAPMVAAPDPTEDSALVISMFSEVYSDVPVDTWQTVWSVGTLTDLQVAGNPTKRYTDVEFVGIETLGPNLLDVTDMEYFHVDVWTPNVTNFKIKLVDFGADQSFMGGDDTEHELSFTNPDTSTWVSYKIPLTDFTGLMNRDNIAQLIFACEPQGAGIFYIDNVYYSKDPVVGIETFGMAGLQTFPNPTTSKVNFEAEQPIEQIRVFSVLGQEIMSAQPLTNRYSIDLSAYHTGVYVVQVTINGETTSQRIIRQ